MTNFRSKKSGKHYPISPRRVRTGTMQTGTAHLSVPKRMSAGYRRYLKDKPVIDKLLDREVVALRGESALKARGYSKAESDMIMNKLVTLGLRRNLKDAQKGGRGSNELVAEWHASQSTPLQIQTADGKWHYVFGTNENGSISITDDRRKAVTGEDAYRYVQMKHANSVFRFEPKQEATVKIGKKAMKWIGAIGESDVGVGYASTDTSGELRKIYYSKGDLDFAKAHGGTNIKTWTPNAEYGSPISEGKVHGDKKHWVSATEIKEKK